MPRAAAGGELADRQLVGHLTSTQLEVLGCRGVARRCFLVFALARQGMTAREANDRLNEYVADRRRGLAVWHDHFVGVHGGAVVLDVRSQAEQALLDDPGPLDGWRLSVHPLTFSLSAVGFAAQISFTLEHYRDVSLDELAGAEPDDPRFWWQRRTA
jgi:hypothetical protein